MTEFTTPKYRQSGTSWQIQHDALLDQISWREDCINRAGEQLMVVIKAHPEVEEELTQTLEILFETKIDNDIRRGFDPQDAGMVDSASTEKKEELV